MKLNTLYADEHKMRYLRYYFYRHNNTLIGAEFNSVGALQVTDFWELDDYDTKKWYEVKTPPKNLELEKARKRIVPMIFELPQYL